MKQDHGATRPHERMAATIHVEQVAKAVQYTRTGFMIEFTLYGPRYGTPATRTSALAVDLHELLLVERSQGLRVDRICRPRRRRR